MFTNDVDLDKSKASLIQQYKNHIELVFGVTVCVWSRSRLRDRSENGSSCDVEMSTIQLSSQFSQESLEKAKVSNLMLQTVFISESFRNIPLKNIIVILKVKKGGGGTCLVHVLTILVKYAWIVTSVNRQQSTVCVWFFFVVGVAGMTS